MMLQVGVKILIKNSAGKYLFVRRAASFKASPQKWDIPGGRIEPEEALEAALRREVKEEAGLELNTIDTLIAAQDIFVPEKDLHVVRLTYVGTADGDVTISHEHDDFKPMTLDEFRGEEHVDKYLLQVITENNLLEEVR